MTRPVLTGLPSDATLHSVRHDWERNAFGFVLQSAAFEVVDDGCVLPRYGGTWGVHYEAVRLPASAPAKYPDAYIKATFDIEYHIFDTPNIHTRKIIASFPDRADAELFLAAVTGRPL